MTPTLPATTAPYRVKTNIRNIMDWLYHRPTRPNPVSSDNILLISLAQGVRGAWKIFLNITTPSSGKPSRELTVLSIFFKGCRDKNLNEVKLKPHGLRRHAATHASRFLNDAICPRPFPSLSKSPDYLRPSPLLLLPQTTGLRQSSQEVLFLTSKTNRVSSTTPHLQRA